jgi:hypothetical protein
MILNIKLPDGYTLQIPVDHTTTNRVLYDSVLNQLPKGSAGILTLAGKDIPYDDNPIYYENISFTGTLHFIFKTNINDVDNQYNILGETISELGRIYLLWRQNLASKDQVKVASNKVKIAINDLNRKINLL